ncbi:MarR family winged helix-turn-helix transcriptional regulator [Rhodococcus koreensis]
MNGGVHRSGAAIAEFGEPPARNRVHSEPVTGAKIDLIDALMRTQRMLSSQLSAAFTPFGVSWAGYEIMQLLVRFDRSPVSILAMARHLERHWTSIAHTLNGLERAGHVIRYRNPAYRRENLVELTDAGHEAWIRAGEALAETAALCSSDADSAAALLAGLGSVERALRTIR